MPNKGVRLTYQQIIKQLLDEVDRHKLVSKYFMENGTESKKQIVRNILGVEK